MLVGNEGKGSLNKMTAKKHWHPPYIPSKIDMEQTGHLGE